MSLEARHIVTLAEFNSLYSDFNDRFVVIANSYLQERALAEDIVNESFISFWEDRQEHPLSESEMPAYILGIVKHKCIDALRSKESALNRHKNIYEKACLEAQLRVLNIDELTSRVFSKDIEKILRRELDRMPKMMANIFMASRLDGKTYKEISEIYNIPVRMVTRRIQEALAALRKSLCDYLPEV